MKSHSILVTLVVATLTFGFLTTAPQARAALVGYWTFDDNTSASTRLSDDSGNGNTLTIGGTTPAYSTSGFSGGAFDFNGTGRLIAPINVDDDVKPPTPWGAAVAM